MEERILKLEMKVERLGNLVNALINKINLYKYYSDADISGVRKATSDIMPYTKTKIGYYGESEKTFYDAPEGNTSVFFDNYNGSYSVKRVENRLVVSFDALIEATNITISIQ